MTEKEKINNSNISQLKKDYLLWSKSTKVNYTLGQFEILQKYEDRIGKDVWNFTEEEYLLFFKDKVPAGARINLNQQIKNPPPKPPNLPNPNSSPNNSLRIPTAIEP